MTLHERTQALTDRTLIRVGAIAGIAGGLLGLVGNLAHPQADDLNDTLAQIQLVADSDFWLVDHLLIMLGVLLVTAFVDTLQRTITTPLAAALARYGFVLQIVSAATIVVLIGIDGIASKEIFNEWAAARGTEREILTQISIAIEEIDFGVFTTFMILQYGLVFIAIGAAVSLSGTYNQFLGLAAVIFGAFGTIMGIFWAFNGLSPTAAALGFGAILAQLLWVIIMSIGMLRKPLDTNPAANHERAPSYQEA